MIVAVDNANGIGKANDLPWRFTEDLRFFKRKTIGKLYYDTLATAASGTVVKYSTNAIIMGKTTYESIGKPLPHRVNLVLSTSLYAKHSSSQSREAAYAWEEARENYTAARGLRADPAFTKARPPAVCDAQLLIFDSVEALLIHCEIAVYPECWVIGGASIYREFFRHHAAAGNTTNALLNELYITSISGNFQCDQFFPTTKQALESHTHELFDHKKCVNRKGPICRTHELIFSVFYMS